MKISNTGYSNNYTIKFENGVVATYDSLDDIFSLENSGSGLIVRFELECILDKKDDFHKISLKFRKIDSNNESESIPIKYEIFGKSRDWVFITGSMIDERILKIKRKSFLFLKGNNSKLYTSLLIPFSLLITLFAQVYSLKSDKNTYLSELKNQWLAGKIKDPIDFIIQLEEKKSQIDLPMSMFLYTGLIIVALIVLPILAMIYLKLYPKYNFCWGDYLINYEKIESRRKFINIVIILGLIISIIGSLIATKIINII